MTETAAYEQWESHLPGWQQWLNQFCENWIFAFVVAMAIRGLLIEAYRIPSASMEPIMYGDTAILSADHVVVDRMSHYFVDPDRWDVTVFQYPRPEVIGPGGAVIAADQPGAPELTFWNRTHRNFVKRCVILPGDTFYISGGDVHLQQPDGAFQVPEKPESVQEALWLAVYDYGEQPGYLPWQAEGGAMVADADGHLLLNLQGGVVRFTQDMINLYLKPGLCRVAPLEQAEAARRDGRMAPDFGQKVEVSMTAPQFVYHNARGEERIGSIWDLNSWEVSRLTTDDLDSERYGTRLNPIMNEQVGDYEVLLQVAELNGSVALQLAEGDVQAFQLHLMAAGWRLTGNGAELASGDQAPVGRRFRLVHLDDRLQLFIGDTAVTETIATQPVVPDADPTHLSWSGNGSVRLAALRLRRDVHYSRNGFLADERSQLRERDPVSGLTYAQMERLLQRGAEAMPAEGAMAKQQLYRDWASRLVLHRYQLQQQQMVREQLLGQPLRAGSDAALAALAESPDTAVTAPEGAYLMLGDNSPHSMDSRAWGWVPAANIRGEVLAIAFPPWRWNLVR